MMEATNSPLPPAFDRPVGGKTDARHDPERIGRLAARRVSLSRSRSIKPQVERSRGERSDIFLSPTGPRASLRFQSSDEATRSDCSK